MYIAENYNYHAVTGSTLFRIRFFFFCMNDKVIRDILSLDNSRIIGGRV